MIVALDTLLLKTVFKEISAFALDVFLLKAPLNEHQIVALGMFALMALSIVFSRSSSTACSCSKRSLASRSACPGSGHSPTSSRSSCSACSCSWHRSAGLFIVALGRPLLKMIFEEISTAAPDRILLTALLDELLHIVFGTLLLEAPLGRFPIGALSIMSLEALVSKLSDVALDVLVPAAPSP